MNPPVAWQSSLHRTITRCISGPSLPQGSRKLSRSTYLRSPHAYFQPKSSRSSNINPHTYKICFNRTAISNYYRYYSTSPDGSPHVIHAQSAVTNQLSIPQNAPGAQDLATAIVFEVIEPTTTSTAVETVMKIGDLKAMGLVHNTPVGLVEALLEAVKVFSGLPWWATICLTTIAIRFALVPLAIKGARSIAKLAQLTPQLSGIMENLKAAQLSGDREEVLKRTREMQEIYAKNGVNPLKGFLLPLVQAPIFFSFFMALRDMAKLPVPGLENGGILWFTDLTATDPYYALPLAASAGFLTLLEIGFRNNPNPTGVKPGMKLGMRCLGLVSLPFTIWMPTAVLVYFTTSTGYSILQAAILNQKGVKKVLNIPDPPRIIPKDQKSVIDTLKELINEVQDGQKTKQAQLDDLQIIRRKRRRL